MPSCHTCLPARDSARVRRRYLSFLYGIVDCPTFEMRVTPKAVQVRSFQLRLPPGQCPQPACAPQVLPEVLASIREMLARQAVDALCAFADRCEADTDAGKPSPPVPQQSMIVRLPPRGGSHLLRPQGSCATSSGGATSGQPSSAASRRMRSTRSGWLPCCACPPRTPAAG